MPGIYLEPVGLLYGTAALEAVTARIALPLAGGPIAFAAVRLWEGEPGSAKHSSVQASAAEAIAEPRVKELLERITSPRPPFAGLSLNTPRLMGVVNVTPDSFSDGGDYFEVGAAVAHAEKLAAEGAEILDIGGESTRPGANTISNEEELRRVLPVIAGAAKLGVPLSIDTRKPEVMRQAAKAGASLINDVSGLSFASDSISTAAALRLPVIIMHAQGSPDTMQENPSYNDVVLEVYDFLEQRIESVMAAGLPRTLIAADPGIGFGKNFAHNLSLFESLSFFHGLGVPLVLGASRKGFIRRIAGEALPKDRVAGSLAATLAAVSQGVQIHRVHDVGATRQALSVWVTARMRQEIAS
jgi:dihydropteroate synthase